MRTVRGARAALLAMATICAVAVPLAGGAGPAAAAVLCGGEAPTLLGSSANDLLNGTPGHDVIAGLSGDDEIRGLGGDDVLCGGPGDDHLFGGPGRDLVAFNEAPTGGVLDLAARTATVDGDDTVQGVEDARGGPWADVLRGDGHANTLTAGVGDVLEGRGGDDTFTVTEDGDGGAFAVSYESAPGPVTVDINAWTATGAAGHDRFFPFEPTGIVGSAFSDRLTCSSVTPRCYVDGGRGNDVITGTTGEDTFVGGLGDDRIVGRGGPDMVRYDRSTTPVTVDLGAGTATGQGHDTLVGIAGAVGSPRSDTLVGGPLAGCLLEGDRGDDRIRAGTAKCALTGGPGNDTLTGGAGPDLIYPDGDLSGGRDTVAAGPGNDVVMADGGNDVLDGGLGTDTLDHSDATGPIVADLTTGVVTGVGSDTVRRFEHLIGSKGSDTLRGADGPDVIDGGGGNDTISGMAGNDVVSGDMGDDTLSGGPGTDTVAFRSSAPGVTVDLRQGEASGGPGFDHISEFENILGGDGDDDLIGDAGPNVIDGGSGIDACTGNGGVDAFRNCP